LFTEKPDGVPDGVEFKKGNSFPNLTIISEAPGNKLCSLPEIVV
jgi:hypothetical protein